MSKLIQQICVNPETGKSIYLVDYNEGTLSYRVSSEPKTLHKEQVAHEGDNVIVGQFFFHNSYLNNFIEKNQ